MRAFSFVFQQTRKYIRSIQLLKISQKLHIVVPFAPRSLRFCASIDKNYDDYDNYGQNKYFQLLGIIGSISLLAAYLREKLTDRRKKSVHSCGIVGYIGNSDANSVLIEGIEILQNRGYDSCGLSTIDSFGNLKTTKHASHGTTSDCIELVKKESKNIHSGNKIGIAHTRWATHGAKVDENAHPHHDYQERISLVHNGTINNYKELKKKLIDASIPFKSETDSEVISNLIGFYIDQGYEFEPAVHKAIGDLQGTWGLCIIHKDHPDMIILARNGSPLLVGGSEGQIFVASEPAALARHTNQYLALKDGEVAIITRAGIDHLSASHAIQRIHLESVETSPHPYEHWTIKEIYEQPQSLARALNYGGRISASQNKVKLGGLDNNRETLLEIDNILICGCGTSFYAGLYGQMLLQYLMCFDTCQVVDASEVDANTFPKHNPGILLISQSGETMDTVSVCRLAESLGTKRLSIVNSVGSLLARLTNCGIYLNAGREVAVASTKSYTSQVIVLALLAAWFAQNKNDSTISQDRVRELMDAIHRIPVYAGMVLGCDADCEIVAKKLKNSKSIFILGKKFGYSVALEGALKIKEISGIHAEGFTAGSLKHGPISLIDDTAKTPVIAILLADEFAPYIQHAMQQVRARGAQIVCITDDESLSDGLADDTIVIPSNGPLTALLAVICLQIISYHMAVQLGINPDKPRGLAKTVTVF